MSLLFKEQRRGTTNQWKTNFRVFQSARWLWFLSLSSLTFYSSFIMFSPGELSPTPIRPQIPSQVHTSLFLTLICLLLIYNLIMLISISHQSMFALMLSRVSIWHNNSNNACGVQRSTKPFTLKITLRGIDFLCVFYPWRNGRHKEACYLRLTSGSW